MLFRSAVAVLTVLLVSQNALANASPDQVSVAIESVATTSLTLTTALTNVDTSMTSSQISSVALTVTNGFSQIVSDVGNAVTMIRPTAPFNASGAQLVVNALLAFIEIHKTLLSIVIGKHTFFPQFGHTAPILLILRTLETGVDAFVTVLIGVIPTESGQARNGFNSLDDSVHNCITTYNEFCLPSLLYPKIKPICVSFGAE